MFSLPGLASLRRRGVQLVLSVVLLLGCVALTQLRDHLLSGLQQQWQGLSWFRPVPQPVDLEALFVPSGWMGDARQGAPVLRLETGPEPAPDGSPTTVWTYQPDLGRLDWLAVAYQNGEGNFGSRPGRNFHGLSYSRLTFWIRGTPGGVVVCKSGGHTEPGAPYPASHECARSVTLTPGWREITLALPADADLRNVCCGFAFALEARHWPEGGFVELAGLRLR